MYWIDQITYGTPTQEQYEILNRDTYLDALYPELSGYGYPKNSSTATKEELNQISENIIKLQNDSEWKRRYFMYDRMLKRYYKEGLSDDSEISKKIVELVDSVFADSSPLLLKLKYYFNRPRPRQLASAYKLKLFPFTSASDNTPSFPSGHAFHSRLLLEVLGNTFPKSYANLKKLHTDVCYSRVYMGLHYQSDIDTGIFFAEKVIENQEFKLKYVL